MSTGDPDHGSSCGGGEKSSLEFFRGRGREREESEGGDGGDK